MSKPVQKYVTDCCGWDKWKEMINGYAVCCECDRPCELIKMGAYASDKISSCCGDDIKIIDDEFICTGCQQSCEPE